jgi:hypothetical protein
MPRRPLRRGSPSSCGDAVTPPRSDISGSGSNRVRRQRSPRPRVSRRPSWSHADRHSRGLRLGCPARARRAPGFQSVPPQPMPDGRLAPIDSDGDLSDRHALLDQREKLVPSNAAPRRVPIRPHCPQPVELHPVSHRRFMSPNPPPDRSKRHSLPQQPLQQFPIHTPDLGGANVSGNAQNAHPSAKSVPGP